MPYYISDQNPECNGWAVVKSDNELVACHVDKESAIDNAVAISLSEGEEFLGELRVGEGPDAIISDIDGTLIFEGVRNEKVWRYLLEEGGAIIIITGRNEETRAETEAELEALEITYDALYMNPGAPSNAPEFKLAMAQELLGQFEIEYAIDDNEEARRNYASLGIEAINPADLAEIEDRQVDLSAPSYFRASARRGLEWYEAGLGGDGLVERTITEARAMANGNITADKWVRLRAWISRHLVDMDSAAEPGTENYPTPGQVAMALWGGGWSRASATRALEYADTVVGKIEEENQDRKGAAMQKLETRRTPSNFEIREDGDGMTFEGYAAVFNSPSEPLPFIERILPGAFKRSLKARNNILFYFNHDSGNPLASTRSGTLKLAEDDRGLRVSAKLPNTSLGRDVAELIRTGVLDAMSFGFTVPPQGDTWNSDGTERTLKSVRLLEVSLVSQPAYTATAGTTTVRGLDKAASRADVDPEELAGAWLKLEAGEDLTKDESELLTRVIHKLTPVQDEPQPDATNALAILALKKKRLDLLERLG